MVDGAVPLEKEQAALAATQRAVNAAVPTSRRCIADKRDRKAPVSPGAFAIEPAASCSRKTALLIATTCGAGQVGVRERVHGRVHAIGRRRAHRGVVHNGALAIVAAIEREGRLEEVESSCHRWRGRTSASARNPDRPGTCRPPWPGPRSSCQSTAGRPRVRRRGGRGRLPPALRRTCHPFRALPL